MSGLHLTIGADNGLARASVRALFTSQGWDVLEKSDGKGADLLEHGVLAKVVGEKNMSDLAEFSRLALTLEPWRTQIVFVDGWALRIGDVIRAAPSWRAARREAGRARR